MSEYEMSVSCEEIRELAKDDPEHAAIIIEMLKAAGEQCTEVIAEHRINTTEH